MAGAASGRAVKVDGNYVSHVPDRRKVLCQVNRNIIKSYTKVGLQMKTRHNIKVGLRGVNNCKYCENTLKLTIQLTF